MKKKLALAIAVCLAGMMSAGCSKIPDLTEEEADTIAEYAADTLLKYDKNYNARYIGDAIVEAKAEAANMGEKASEEPQATATPKAKKSKSTSTPTAEPTATPVTEQTTQPEETQAQTPPPQVTATPTPLQDKMDPHEVGRLFGMDGVEVNYIGFEAVDTYPVTAQNEMALTMDAPQGAKLIITKFELINTSDTAKNCNIAGQNVKFQMRFNSSDYVAAQKTLLSDDLASFNGVLQPGESKQAVVVSQVNAGYEKSITNVDLIVRIAGENTLLKLQ